MGNKVVYIHKRATDGKIFYVGIGKPERPYIIQKRNPIWHGVVLKYGYKVEVIHEHLEAEDAARIEVELIAKYGRRDLKKGYLTNLTDGGEGTTNPSPDSISKRVEKTNKAISAYFLSGKFSKHFKSAVIASKELGILKHNITSACRGDLAFAGDFIWCYKGEIPEENIKTWAQMLDERSQRITIFKAYTKEGEFVEEFFNLKSAKKLAGLKRENKIKQCLDRRIDNQGKRSLAPGGYIFIYSKEATPDEIKKRVEEIKSHKKGANLALIKKEKKVNMLDLEGNLVKTFESVKAAKQFVGTSARGVNESLAGRQKSAYGYIWKHQI